MDLCEVAKLVAEALNLTAVHAVHYSRCLLGYLHDAKRQFGGVLLLADGSNLTDDFWRCRCEEWLIEHDEDFQAEACMQHLGCPWPEVPARLVAAVWSRMKASAAKERERR